MKKYQLKAGKLWDFIVSSSGTKSADETVIRSRGKKFYGGVVILVVILSAVFMLLVPVGIVEFCLAALWGICLGFVFLIYLPPKLIITILGATIGSGITGLTDLVPWIENTNKIIEKIIATVSDSQFEINSMAVWVFIVIVGVFCIPAYAETE